MRRNRPATTLAHQNRRALGALAACIAPPSNPGKNTFASDSDIRWRVACANITATNRQLHRTAALDAGFMTESNMKTHPAALTPVETIVDNSIVPPETPNTCCHKARYHEYSGGQSTIGSPENRRKPSPFIRVTDPCQYDHPSGLQRRPSRKMIHCNTDATTPVASAAKNMDLVRVVTTALRSTSPSQRIHAPDA